jgi:hypothetical protein
MKRFLLYVFIVLSVFSGKSQNGNRLEALKIAYITNKLNLSPEEAQRFWPIYNLYADELKSARIEALKNNSSEIQLDESLLNVRKKYNTQFNQVISPQKVDIFFKSEKEFGHFVQEELKRRQMKNQRRLDTIQ